jgi:hypothetical protein
MTPAYFDGRLFFALLVAIWKLIMTEQDERVAEYGENYHFEFLFRGVWTRSPHLARPRQEAEALVKRLNAPGNGLVYRYVPWDGQ